MVDPLGPHRSKDDAKACLQFYFALISSFAVAMLTSRGILRRTHLYYDAVGLPAAVAGIALGVALYGRMDQRLFGRLIVAALLVAGVSYIGHAMAELIHDSSHAVLLAHTALDSDDN